MINLQRFLNPIDLEYMRRSYAHLINKDNIEFISVLEIHKIFKNEDPKLVEAYLHNVVHRWVEDNYQNNETSYSRLKRLLKKVGIKLNEIEAHDLLILEERSFSLFRHIKILEVDIDLEKGETCGAKFVHATINKFKKTIKQIDKGDLLITNYRLILKGPQQVRSFYFKDIINSSYENYGFQFEFEGEKYVVRIHDQVTLNNTLRNLISKIKHH